MTYNADCHPRAIKGIKQASSEMRSRIRSRVDDLCESPYLGTRVVGDKSYESRVSSSRGAYRTRHSICKSEHKITFLDIGKHKILGC